MKLPKTIYVRNEKETNGTDIYLIANDESIAAAIEDDGPTQVGTYELKEVGTYSKQAVVTKKGK